MSLWTDDRTDEPPPRRQPRTPSEPAPPPRRRQAPPPPPRQRRSRWPAALGGGSRCHVCRGLTPSCSARASQVTTILPSPRSRRRRPAGRYRRERRQGRPRAQVYAAASPSVVSVRTRAAAPAPASWSTATARSSPTLTWSATRSRCRCASTTTATARRARSSASTPSTDLAALKVDAERRTACSRSSSRTPTGPGRRHGVAIGYPLGLDRTATAGIVSGLERQIQAPNGFSIDKVIQTDAPVNPGNSGGPLLDARGRVIGVNSQIATAGGGEGNVGIGFAIPANTVKEVLPAARERQRARARLPRPVDQRRRRRRAAPDRPGHPGRPSAAARPADGRRRDPTSTARTSGADDVAAAIEDNKPGDKVDVHGPARRLRADRRGHARPAAGSDPDATGPDSPEALPSLVFVGLTAGMGQRGDDQSSWVRCARGCDARHLRARSARRRRRPSAVGVRRAGRAAAERGRVSLGACAASPGRLRPVRTPRSRT